MSKPLRPLGHILLDLEELLQEMYIEHELQLGDVLGMVYTNTTVHFPSAIEKYNDGSQSPVLNYAPAKLPKKIRKKK